MESRRSTFSVVRDFVSSGAGLASSSGGSPGAGASPGFEVGPSTFADLPIGTVLFPAQKTRAQMIKVDRGDVSYMEHERRNGNDVSQAVKNFVSNVLLNNDFIDAKKKPKVLITVTGGAGAYVIPPAIEPIFCKGLMKAARATNAWIVLVTGGTDSGVMKAVGEAYRKHSVENFIYVPCIGIASYNALNNKQILLPSNKTIEYTALPGGAPPLNPYHTHFVLVDGQKQMRDEKDVFGHEIEFRSDLESYICSSEMFDIPLLLVVVGGGPGTLKTVYEGVVRKFPGGVADAISYRIQQKTDPGKRVERDEWDAWIKREAARITPDHEKFMSMIVDNSDYVQIYDPSSHDSLEVFLFESIFNCDKYGGFISKMELAVSCNQLEVVSGLIAGLAPEDKSEHMKRTMQFSVQSDRADIFDSLIEQTANRSLDLLRLYKFIFAKRSRWARFYPILSQTTIKELEKTQQLIKQESRLIFSDKEKMMSGAQIPLQEMTRNGSTKDVLSPSANSLLEHFLNDVFLRSGRIYDYYRQTLSLKLGLIDGADTAFSHMRDEKVAKVQRSKLADVMMWALLMGHSDLAKVAWTHTTLPTHTALIASHFCKLLATRFANEGTGYTDLAAEFETKAIQVLEKMSYKEAKEVLSYKYDEFKMNLLEIADLAESKEFTSHPYVQRYVDELLFQNKYGELPPSTSMWKIVLCILPLFYFWIYHPKLKNDEQINQGKYSRFMYYTLPIVKFWSNTLCYIGFIVLCSYVLIVSEPRKYSITGAEVLLFVWMAALLLEEVSQLLEDGPVQYLSRVSNQIDMLMLLLFLAYFILKLIAAGIHDQHVNTAATDLFVVATIIVYLRLLNMFAFSPQLGPLYFVVLRCVDDVLQWLFIFILFCMGSSIAFIVCVRQNGLDPFKPFTEGGTFAVGFYTIVGEYTDAFPDLGGNPFGLVILSIYALIAQVVLVNLLIAMMGDTFNTVKEDSDKEWRFTRYSLATEYSSTSAIAPPFNLVVTPLKAIMRQIRKPAKSKKNVPTVHVRRLKSLSRKFVEEILEDEKEMKKRNLDGIADSLKSHIKKLSNETSEKLIKIEGLMESSPASGGGVRSLANTSSTSAGQAQDVVLQSQVAEINRNMAALKESLRGGQAQPSKPLTTFALQLPNKMLTVSLEEGVTKELGQRAAREFAPLVAFLRTISSNTEQQWDVQEITIHSVDTASPSGAVSFKWGAGSETRSDMERDK